MTDAAGLRNWPPKLSDFRLACEECHKRKIRCEAPQEGLRGSCQACRTNHRACIFSLKNKTGRPPKFKPSQVPRAHKTPSTRASVSQAGPGLLPWLPTVAAGRNGHDPLMNSPSDGDLPADSRLGHSLGDDFILGIPEGVTNHPAFSAFPHNDQHELWRRERPNDTVLWTPPLTAAPSGGRDPQDTRRADPARNGAEALRANVNAAMSGDLSNTMRLCGEMNDRHQSKLLNIMARGDERELSAILGNIEELSCKTALAMRNVAGPPGPSSRQEQYNWMLTRVAVMGAVDIAADLIQHNLSIHKIKGPAVRENDIEDGSGLGVTDATAAPNGRSGQQQQQHCENNLSSGAPADSLKSVLSLIRLDYALLQFSLFLSADQCAMDGCRCAGPSAGMSRPGDGCPRGRRTSTLARMGQIRAQVWALAEGIRGLW